MASIASFKQKLTDAVMSSPLDPCSSSPAFHSHHHHLHLPDSPLASSISIEDLNVLDGPDALRFFEQEPLLLIDDSSLFHGSASTFLQWPSQIPFDDQNGTRELYTSWSLDEEDDGHQHTPAAAAAAAAAEAAAPACLQYSLPSVLHTHGGLELKESLEKKSNVSREHSRSGKVPQSPTLNSCTGLKLVDMADCDAMDNLNEDGPCHTGRRSSSSSKNIFSERRRRRKLNEKLYSLRSLVPKISKMDKASIVNDAIDHVRNLQRLVETLQDEVRVLRKRASGGDVEEPMPCAHSATSPLLEDMEHKVLKVDVAKMEETTYNLRVLCRRGCGVSVKLARAMESLELEIVHANLTSVKDQMLNTVFMKAKDGRIMEPLDLREMILEVLPKFGLRLATQG